MRLGRPAVIIGAQREELWRRYKAGETILGIARALDQRQTTIRRVLQVTGGMTPARRSRSSRVLSFWGARRDLPRSGCRFHLSHAPLLGTLTEPFPR